MTAPISTPLCSSVTRAACRPSASRSGDDFGRTSWSEPVRPRRHGSRAVRSPDPTGACVRYQQFIKKLAVPSGFEAPARLTHQDIVAVAITREHLDDDVRGINASIELIQVTRGGGWPTEPVTAEFNFVDLVWHEQ